ncbi:MAG TPA: response regulator [Kofleriaceae bacterium]|nr:response regulator [Kofleriaceae bacterium]
MSKVILCVDDSVTMQTVAEITFRATDYTYVGARTVDEALEKARTQKPALVLADAIMTGKNGYDLCHTLKSDPSTSSVPVVILCGNSAPYDTTRGAQVGADGTLTKPWDTQVMLDKIAEMLDKIGQTGVAKATSKSAPMAAAAPVHTPAPQPAAAAAAPAPAAAAAAVAQKGTPPRSATIMGMPTIKMPGTPGGTGPAPAHPTPTSVPVAQPAVAAAPRTGQTPVATPVVAAAAAPAHREPGFGGGQRAPMIAGIPTKKSVLVERTLAKMGERLAELSGLPPASPELLALVKLSSEIVERVVWEVVPELAETMIREHVAELAARRAN